MLILVGGLLVWWILRGPTTAPPSRQQIAGLSDTVSVSWTEQHTALLNASTSSDALTALGYVHGITRPWTVTVWRRTALGTLSAAFGDALVPLDRHARRLGFGHSARRTYARLPDSTRDRLQAYVRGLNAALQSNRVQQQAPFLSLSFSPQQWMPWHPLAISRLLAWTSTDVSTLSPLDETQGAAFPRSDRLLRRWLHLHGHRRSMAWAARSDADSTEAVLFARHVFGSTADPILQEVALQNEHLGHTTLATLPGTLLAPTGSTQERAWTALLGSPVTLERMALDSTRVHTRHERIQPASGSEHLVAVHRYDEGLLVSPNSPDSAWVLQWPGLQAHETVSSWSTGASFPPDSAFIAQNRLFQKTGLTLGVSGRWQVQGTPPLVERRLNSIFVGHSPWAEHQAEALRTHRTTDAIAPARWSQSDSSTWAADLLPRMVPDLGPLAQTNPTVTTALSYLRNWNHVYERSSIGAVLFEEWMRLYRETIGRLPTPTETAFFAAPRRRRTFQRAVHRLAARYGTDVRQWRWGRVAPDRRYYPVWSADSLVTADLGPLSTTRFAPLDRPGRGHPSTLAGGPALVDSLPLGPAPTQWDGWMWSDSTTLTVRRLRFDPSGFFARSLLSREPPAPISVTEAPVTRATTLLPAKP